MTTINVTVADDADDGWVVGSTFKALGGTSGIGTGGGRRGFLRFTGLSIPPGSGITSATLMVTATGGSADVPSQLRAEASDDATRPTSGGDLSGRIATSASIPWRPASWESGASVTAPDISPVVQEVVNRPGWASGNAFMILWESTSENWLSSIGGPPYSTLSVTYTDAPPSRNAAAVQTFPALMQSAAVTVTVPAFTGSIAQTLPSVAQSATAVGPFTPIATVDGTDVLLSWAAKPGSGYAVERDGAIVAFGLTDLAYTDTPGEGEHTYRIGVLA